MKLAACFGSSLLALAMATAPGMSLQAQPFHPGAAQNYDHGRDQWDMPPNNLNDVERRGFQDGITAARNDMEAHNKADAHNRPLFHNPPVRKHLRDEYRNGFVRGYDVAVHHARYYDDHGWRRHGHDHDQDSH